MTTQESLLALAKAVYPDYEWKMDGGFPYRMVRTDRYVIFNPAGDDRQYQGASEQAMEVLCWLLAECKGYAHAEMGTVGIFYDGGEEGDGHWRYFLHDNTPASLREAIVQAACRVVGA